MIKNIVYLLPIMIFTFCGQKNTEKAIVIGMELAYPPFETKTADGTATGISVDIAHAFGEYVSKPIKIENIAWNGLIPSLQTKKIDMVISSMTITEDRKEQVSFSDPYARSTLALLVNKNAGISNYLDLNQENKTVAVKQGTLGFFFAQKHLPNAKLNSFASESAAIVEVSQGKADAFIYDPLTVYRNYAQDKENLSMVAIDNALFTENVDWGIAVRKDNTELLTQINDFLTEFKKNGGYEQLINKHLKEEKKAFDQFDFDFFF